MEIVKGSPQEELIHFEDDIRMEAMPLDQAVTLPLRTKNSVYVVGQLIGGYIDSMRKLGFRDLWEIDQSRPKQFIARMMSHVNVLQNRDTCSMYGYIDYVLEDLNSEVAVFLPKRSFIVAKDIYGSGSRTGDEINRVLHHHPQYYNNLHFVTGLFDLKVTEFAEKYIDSK